MIEKKTRMSKVKVGRKRTGGNCRLRQRTLADMAKRADRVYCMRKSSESG